MTWKSESVRHGLARKGVKTKKIKWSVSRNDSIEHNFKFIGDAEKKQMALAKKYGYVPEVFKVTNPKTKKVKYTVIEPKGMSKI